MPPDSLDLILACCDVGAAGHIAALASGARARGLKCLVVAQGPAQAYFSSRQIPYVTVGAWLGADVDEATYADAAPLAGQQVLRFGASAVVCGRSLVADCGIDRMLIDAARRVGIPSLVVQDFWGDVWPEIYRPDHYLVIDALAASLTCQRTSATAHVIGSLKHAEYLTRDFAQLRCQGREMIGLTNTASAVIGYFGQDLAGLAGYGQVLRDVGAAIARLGPVTLFYKPHPRETRESSSWTMSLLRDSGAHPVLVKSLPIEMAIAAADLVLHCFSTVALDAAYMMCAVDAPEVAVVCVDYPDDVRAYWRPATGLSAFPLVSQGIALAAHDGASLDFALRAGLEPTERRRQAWACRSAFGSPGVPLDNALRLIGQLTGRSLVGRKTA